MKKMNLFYRTVVLLVFAIAITVMGVGCCCVDPYDDDDSDRYSAETDSYQDIMLTAQTGFSLESVNGSIEIQASSSDSVIQVWAEKKVKADSQWEADRYLDQLEVRISSNSDEVFVETRYPHVDDVTFIVNYNIVIPEDMDVQIDHVNGDIVIRSLKSSADVDLTNGDIEFVGCHANVWAYLTNGEIGADLTLPEKGTCQLYVTNGQIELSLPESVSAELDASIVNGDISINNLEMTSTQISNKSTKGILGDGDGLIKLNVTNGHIDVRGRY